MQSRARSSPTSPWCCAVGAIESDLAGIRRWTSVHTLKSHLWRVGSRVAFQSEMVTGYAGRCAFRPAGLSLKLLRICATR